MKIDDMITTIKLYLQLYLMYAKKIFDRSNDINAKAMILISLRYDDIKEIINDILKEKEKFYELVKEGNYSEAYIIYKNIEYKYKIAEKMLLERIENLVKIRALELSKKY